MVKVRVLDPDHPRVPYLVRKLVDVHEAVLDEGAMRNNLMFVTPPCFRDCVKSLPQYVVIELNYICVMYNVKPLSPSQKARVHRLIMCIINNHRVSGGDIAGPWHDRELEYFTAFLQSYECL